MKNFKKGDYVIMHTCHESTLPQYQGKVWKCTDDSYIMKGIEKTEVVFLDGFSGCFSCDYLVKIDNMYILPPKILLVCSICGGVEEHTDDCGANNMKKQEYPMGNYLLSLQYNLRQLLFVRPANIQEIESKAIFLCDEIVDCFEP